MTQKVKIHENLLEKREETVGTFNVKRAFVMSLCLLTCREIDSR